MGERNGLRIKTFRTLRGGGLCIIKCVAHLILHDRHVAEIQARMAFHPGRHCGVLVRRDSVSVAQSTVDLLCRFLAGIPARLAQRCHCACGGLRRSLYDAHLSSKGGDCSQESAALALLRLQHGIAEGKTF